MSAASCPRCGSPAAEEVGGERVCVRCLFGLTKRSPAELESAALAEMETVAGGPPPPDAEAFPRFPNYEILGVLGRGGMGIVYKARQKGLDRVVALKVLRTGIDDDGEAVPRFLNEARSAARLQHAHIVSIHEVATAEGRPFFCMEYVEGQSLSDWLRAPDRTARQIAASLRKVALAVQHAHEAGIVHRDLKPANILVDRSGEPKVTDFGIAKDIAGGEAITKAGMTIGTPCYMAPEQAAGENDRVGPRTDVYALGAILYEALAKRPPFSSSAMSETLRRVLVEDPVPLRKVNPDVPAALEAVAARAMEKDPARRHPSALALAEDLGRFLEGKAAPPRRSWKPLLGGIAAAALLLAAAFAAFPRRGPTASIEDQLEQAVRDARGTDRKRAAAMLLELGAQGIPAWRRLLAAPDPEVRWRAAEALGDLGARQAVPDLARALHDEDQDVARRAAEALASMGSVTEIVRLLEDPSAAVRRRATRQVARLRNERTLPPLLLLLAHAEPGVRESAAATLGLLGARDAAGEIEKLLADEDTDVRQAAANALAALEARERIPALLKLLGDEDGAVRESACSALARLGAREAVPELERLRTEDPSEGVRAAAEEALRTLR